MSKGPTRSVDRNARSRSDASSSSHQPKAVAKALSSYQKINTLDRGDECGPPEPLSVLETTIRKSIIPQLYGQFGPGMIGRNKRPKSLLSKTFKAFLNEPIEDRLMQVDWFSTELDAEHLLERLNAQDHQGALEILETVKSRGGTFTDICTNLISNVAVLMNCRWQDDVMSFVDVTLTATLLKRVLRSFAYQNIRFLPSTHPPKAALITTIPGEGHNLGAQIIEYLFIDKGWAVTAANPLDVQDLSVEIRKKWFTLVGISVSEQRLLERCGVVVDDIRANSLNPDVIIMAGGQAVTRHPDAVQLIDADVVAHDARHALSIAAKIDSALEYSLDVGGAHGRLKKQWTNESHDQKRPNSKGRKRPLTD